MKLSRIGRVSLATVASLAIALGMTACGGGTIGFLYVLAGKTTSNGTGDSISGYKIDDFTGNLTQAVRSPYSAAGINPNNAVVTGGGRFVYVLNQGDSTGSGSGISFFLLGGDGVLSFQQTYTPQGTFPQYVQLDGTSTHLFVLSKLAPGAVVGGGTYPTGCTAVDCGAITVYAIAGDTGRLTLVTNSTQKDSNNVFISYFPTGPQPFMMKSLSGDVVVLNNDNTYSVLAEGASTGQLTPVNSTPIAVTGAHHITSITSGPLYTYLTDYDSVAQAGTVFPFTFGNGTLNAVNGGATVIPIAGAMPVWTLTESKGRFLYVLNQTTNTSTTAFSSIYAYTIDPTTGKLTPISGTDNPFPVGSGPVCMIEDPSSKYVYTSNSLDSTITGFQINQSTGELNSLQRGSTFTVTGKPACVVVTGSVS